jgi:hypothetical protein
MHFYPYPHRNTDGMGARKTAVAGTTPSAVIPKAEFLERAFMMSLLPNDGRSRCSAFYCDEMNSQRQALESKRPNADERRREIKAKRPAFTPGFPLRSRLGFHYRAKPKN